MYIVISLKKLGECVKEIMTAAVVDPVGRKSC